MTDADKLAEVFKLLSDGPRVRIIQLLRRRSLCVVELTSQLGISRPATSQHLRILRNAGIVKPVKRGVYTYYMLDDKKISVLRKVTNELLSIE
jgi:DNA-binding transcriptional ArsR family regulator